ncbi:MAG: phosphoribosylformylglycinamidine synthase [Gammaproteobacteria bacterium]|nr:MAG: phosphoribosylformylglycinamidine synthase [Gammaproteobacteria bacterium]
MNARQLLQKKEPFQTESTILLADIRKTLHLPQVESVSLFDGFDIFNILESQLETLTWQVLGDPTTDEKVEESDITGDLVFSLEFLPGQFDQRADAAEQAAKLLSDDLRKTTITSFKTYVFNGQLSEADKQKIIRYLLNPVESRLKDLSKLAIEQVAEPEPVAVLDGFVNLTETDLIALKQELGLALTDADMGFIQSHFRSIKRNPTETEIRVLDTYWSDHCRHTTFMTALQAIHFPQGILATRLQQAFDDYLEYRRIAGVDDRPVTLMDLATINARTLRKQGKLDRVEISDEINACSVFINVLDEHGTPEKWLLQFKNETHNHPTEIEPFGGASTCLGGAIRDPLSGRAFVYQAMRVTGSANPLEPVEKTLAGKLPQIKITKGAAHGYSSYGNQIGVATTQVAEIYHQGYKAKRMEVGAVVAAVPAQDVVREKPAIGDKIILLGGKTGRDGCGGASGSSKAHTTESLAKSGAEVQKGNPPVERAIQRLFRHSLVAKTIKKCNDFGAGGVCVAVGELADSLLIDLDKVPTKYAGLSGTELTISESQERMAVVVAPEHVDRFISACEAENTEATVIAEVTDSGAMIITHQGREIVNLSREFIETAGARQYQSHVNIAGELQSASPLEAVPDTDLLARLGELNNASQRGLQDMFDCNVGASTVLLPYGGKRQNSPVDASLQLLPKPGTSTASAMTYGFNADISSYSPFHGGAYAVVEAVTKQIAVGADLADIHFSFQEYFERLGDNPDKWGKPFASLLGAFSACADFELAAIGGKDSMSGSFGDLHVPPTLIAFAVSHLDAKRVISPELKSPGNYLYYIKHQQLSDGTPDFEQLKQNYQWFAENCKHIVSAIAIKHSGVAVELAKAGFGNEIGFKIDARDKDLFGYGYGSLIVESSKKLSGKTIVELGKTTADNNYTINGKAYAMAESLRAYQDTLELVFPLYPQVESQAIVTHSFVDNKTPPKSPTIKQYTGIRNHAKPRVFIPVFPGMNSEYDMANAFERNGATTVQQPFVNLSQAFIRQSLDTFCDQLKNSQILALSGGFSAGDEPNGSGKYIAMVLKNAQIRAAIAEFLEKDGLILGICNGFQALVKSGLLPYGKVTNRSANDVTLEHNNSHRHIARLAQTRVCHTNSPWLSDFSVGDIHDVAFSHGEGRLVANDAQQQTLINNGQIATQYVDNSGQASMNPLFNPNGSTLAIEGLTSIDGRILGKMGHSERYTIYCYKNYPNFREQNIFAAGVKYFT